MDTAEVDVRKKGQDFRRLVRATALLLTGAAVHLWLFPFPLAPGQTRLVDTVTAGLNTVARRSVVGITGRDPGVVTSALGEVVTSARVAEAHTTPANRVRIVIATVHPTLAPSLIEARPAQLADLLLTPVEPPLNMSLERDLGGEDNIAALPPEFPALADTPVASRIVTAAADLEPPPVPGRSVAPPMTRPAPVVHRDRTRREHPSDEGLVSSVLQQYRAAYESLDVNAAQNVWPTVDARALGAAFRQLAGQRVTFASCGVSVSGSGSQATARCTGQAEYVPKVGGHRAYTASGEWVFDLAKENAAWRIINANANIK